MTTTMPTAMAELEIATPSGVFRALRNDVGAAPRPDRPLVLCLHGFPDHAPGMSTLLADLGAAGYPAVAPWMRGYAPSVQGGPYHLERIGADVLALAAALSPDRPVAVIGHDWGALATYAACAVAPARFAAAVTMAVPHPLAFARNLARQPAQLARSWYILFFQLPLVPEGVVARDDFAFIDGLWRRWSAGPVERILDAPARRALHACLAASMPAPLAYYRALTRPPSAAMRRPIEVPTLQLQGERDGCIAAAIGAGQERFFRGPFEAAVVRDAGHWVHLEARAEVASRIVGFLDAQARS